MNKKVYGYTKSGKAIDNEMIEKFVEEAEQGYVGRLDNRKRGRGRPPLGDAAKVVGSLRLDPILREKAEIRANEEGVSISEIQRRALKEYLNATDGNSKVEDRSSVETPFDRQLLSKIEQGMFSMSEYSEWLKQLSGTLQEFSSRLKDFDMGAKREMRKIVTKLQTGSTTQIKRFKSLAEEFEKLRESWDEISHSKSHK
jgi:hypothetical protein